jgi:hypothetical protein
MRPPKGRGPLAGGPLGGWQHAEEDELAAVSIDLTGVAEAALCGWAAALLAHVSACVVASGPPNSKTSARLRCEPWPRSGGANEPAR